MVPTAAIAGSWAERLTTARFAGLAETASAAQPL
jgi:hypothetical protein